MSEFARAGLFVSGLLAFAGAAASYLHALYLCHRARGAGCEIRVVIGTSLLGLGVLALCGAGG